MIGAPYLTDFSQDTIVYLKLRRRGLRRFAPALQRFGARRQTVKVNCSLAHAKSGSLTTFGRPHRPACYTRSEPSLRVLPDFSSLTRKKKGLFSARLGFSFLYHSSEGSFSPKPLSLTGKDFAEDYPEQREYVAVSNILLGESTLQLFQSDMTQLITLNGKEMRVGFLITALRSDKRAFLEKEKRKEAALKEAVAYDLAI